MNKNEYVVISAFRDKFTKEHYAVGTLYASDDSERVAELQEKGFLAVEEVPVDQDTDDDLDERLKKLGGGYYELPNGDKVRGKEKALKALQTLDESAEDGTSDASSDQDVEATGTN